MRVSALGAVALATAACRAPVSRKGPPVSGVVEPPPARTGFVPTPDGTRLFYRVVGAPAPDTLIAVHGGIGFGLASLSPDLDALARNHVVIYYDQRGAGHSEVGRDSTAFTVQDHVRDLEHVVRHFDLAKPSFIGHSWGAGLVVRFVAAHPSRAARIVLLEPAPPRAEPYATAFNDALLAHATAAEVRQYATAMSARSVAEHPLESCRTQMALLMRLWGSHDAAARERVRANLCAIPDSAYQFLQRVAKPIGERSVAGWDLRSTASAIRVPVLIVRGTADPMPAEAIREWATVLPDARVLAITGGGHFAHAEYPSVAVPAMLEFLSGGWPRDSQRSVP